MSWGQISQGLLDVSDSIRKYECAQIYHMNRNYRTTTSFESRGYTNVQWFFLFNYQLQTLVAYNKN